MDDKYIHMTKDQVLSDLITLEKEGDAQREMMEKLKRDVTIESRHADGLHRKIRKMKRRQKALLWVIKKAMNNA